MPAISATMPIGTLIRKIQCQLNEVTSQPPSVGPIAGATIAAMPHTAIARPCWRRGNISNTIVMPTGMSAPPPSPCRTRHRISTPSVGAIGAGRRGQR